jgi:hypothetical protein
MPDHGRFLYRPTHAPDLSAVGTIFPVPHTSSPLVRYSWFCHGLLGHMVLIAALDHIEPLPLGL